MTPGSTILILFMGCLVLGVLGYLLARRKAVSLIRSGGSIHSRPDQHASYVACLAGGFPLFCAIALGFAGLVIPKLAALIPGLELTVPDPDRAPGIFWLVALPALFALGALGLLWGLSRISAEFRARIAFECIVRWVLFCAAFISIATTFGIVASILFEAIAFFRGGENRPGVSLWEFFTGTTWAPEGAFLQAQGDAREGESFAEPQFGSVPIFAGTFMITFIAMAVAVPVGVFAAIFMSEYASKRFREVIKPLLEILAGIPTVVYGFFAAITVAPMVVKFFEWIGDRLQSVFGEESFAFLETVSYQNALTCGLVMGIMIIPLVSSLSDDVIRAVPNSLREGSLALGTTRAETIRKVILPAALPGIISSILLALSSALGETMIVVMAASARANLTINPLEDMTTVTVRIVNSLVGDKSFDSAETLSAFALGLVLFVLTLVLNVVATIIIRRFRRKYAM